MLAFVRRYQDETILVVANLSRFVQHFKLKLAEFEVNEVGGLRRVAHRLDGITTPSRPAATAGVISLTTTPVSSVSSGRRRR